MTDAQLADALDQQAGKDPVNAHPHVRGSCLIFAEAAKRIRELSAASVRVTTGTARPLIWVDQHITQCPKCGVYTNIPGHCA